MQICITLNIFYGNCKNPNISSELLLFYIMVHVLMYRFRNTLSIFKNAITEIQQINEKELRPSSGKVCKDLDLVEVTSIMAEMEIPSKKEVESLVDNHVKRVTNLIFTSTNTTT